MNAIVLNSYTSIGNHVHSFFAKVNRAIHKVGYARAAAELQRMGLNEAARNCMRQYNQMNK